MEVEKRSSKGGFLQLFDWNVKSRKKLFTNKPDLPESSTQGKENLDNLATTTSRFQQMKLHESINNGPSLIMGTDWGSNMSNDEGCGTKAPGVVARLMGLDSLPTLDTSDPGFIDSQSFRHSFNPRMTTEFETEHSLVVNYGMRNKLDGFSRNPVEDRLQKLQNRPIERFQTEVLPPKSAKSVPISHHRMLSPIKSPGFILSRNAAYIMETASKIIEQSPQSTLGQRSPSFRSSSIPLRIRDLKEKMEAAQRTSKLHTNTPVNSTKSQRKIRSEIVVLKQRVPQNKNKPIIPPPTPLKNDKPEGPTPTSRNSRNIPMKQKEDMKKKQRNTPNKKVQNRSTTTATKANEVLTQNNQKQNCASHKDRSTLKPRVPYQNDRKPTSTKKAAEPSSRKEPFPKPKGISGKKKSTEGGVQIREKEKERSVKCNISIDGSSNWEPVDMKNGMDVVSFTFTSPIKKPESENFGQPRLKNKGLTLKFDDEHDVGTSKIPSFGTPMIDSDALSVLLEQKLKELSSLVEKSESDMGNEGSSSSLISDKNEKTFHSNMQKDKGVILNGNDDSLVDQIVVKDKSDWQGVEMSECNSEESGTTTLTSNCITSNSTTTLTSNGNNLYTSSGTMELFAEEIELQDSATSLPNSIFQFTSNSMTKWSSQWEPEYIKKILTHSELSLSPTQKGINVNLHHHLEAHSKNMDPCLKVQRKAIFDCVSICVDSRRERALNGSYEGWAKWSKRKDLLADEIWREICGWMNMAEMEVDEVVERDMSSGEGKWLDFEFEGLEEGIDVENDILNALIDEIVVDFLPS